MNNNEIVSGRGRAWSLLEKMGEGDAGEVYLVESLLEKERAILKRPHRGAFASDKLRQATQIEREAQVLRVLASLDNSPNCLRVPRLLDQSKVGIDQYERFFIIITQALGYDLHLIARSRRFGKPLDQPGIDLDPSGVIFIQRLADLDHFPELLLLRSLKATISFLERTHSFESSGPDGRIFGVIWNDVKPEHIFWDPIQSCFTLIDWGNAGFLDENGVTADRQHSSQNDNEQVLTEFGAFLDSEAPGLKERLEWPDAIDLSTAYTSGIEPLKTRLDTALENELCALDITRSKESELLCKETPSLADFYTLDHLHTQLVGFGEMPEYTSAASFFERIGHHLVSEAEISQFQELCSQSSRIPTLDSEAWRLLNKISDLSVEEPTALNALKAGLKSDWPAALWELRLAANSDPEPRWWERLKNDIRQQYLGTSPEALSPYVALNRLVHMLRAALENGDTVHGSSLKPSSESEIEQVRRELKDSLLKRWVACDPDPPEAGLAYIAAERYLERLRMLLPDSVQGPELALTQPNAQVNITVDAWERQDFPTARRGLRTLLIWDPDRRRVLSADKEIQKAPEWLEAVKLGPREEPRLDFVTRLELRGRSMRQKVAPASWLDSILSAFKSLRKGGEPADVMLQHPELRDVTGWLLELEPNRPLLAFPEQPVSLQRNLETETRPPILAGRAETMLGEDYDMLLGEPLDAWAPEARGSSARVFTGRLRDSQGELQEAAIKLMRPGRTDYAVPLFEEEVHVLQALGDLPGVNQLLESGFVRLEPGGELPPEEQNKSAIDLSGEVRRFGLGATRHFLAELPQRSANGWLPYLALEKRENSNNLLLSCDASFTRGRLLPILDGLAIAIQSLEILDEAHKRSVVYRDHKILHYYWHRAQNGVFVIDWNIAKLHRDGIPNGEIQFDLVQFSARALHHILTGRPAPGALPLGPNRPEEIEAASRSYSVQWTYDDQRLPQSLKDILENSLKGEYQTAHTLHDDLSDIFQKLSTLLQS